MMRYDTTPAADHKQNLVDIGLYALSRGQWHIVWAVTAAVAREGVRDA